MRIKNTGKENPCLPVLAERQGPKLCAAYYLDIIYCIPTTLKAVYDWTGGKLEREIVFTEQIIYSWYCIRCFINRISCNHGSLLRLVLFS